MEETISYVTVEQLESFWRALNEEESARATVLIALATSRLRILADNEDVDLDERAASDEDFKAVLQWVIMESVKRALQTPVDSLPVDTYSQTAGPYSENYRYTNPSGDLWFKKKELAELGLSGAQKIDSITPKTRGDIYYGE